MDLSLSTHSNSVQNRPRMSDKNAKRIFLRILTQEPSAAHMQINKVWGLLVRADCECALRKMFKFYRKSNVFATHCIYVNLCK